MQTANYPQRDPETKVSNPVNLGYLRNLARHIIPMVGTILMYNWGCPNLQLADTKKFEIVRQEPSQIALEEIVVANANRIENIIPELQEKRESPQNRLSVAKKHALERGFQKTLRYADQIRETEEKYNLPEGLLRALIIRESGGNPYAVSRVGAAGLTQLMPYTAEYLGLKVWPNTKKIPINREEYGRRLSDLVRKHEKNLPELPKKDERFNPNKNLEAGAKYLRELHDRFGDWDVVLRAYLIGPNHGKLLNPRFSKRSKPSYVYSQEIRAYQEYCNQMANRIALNLKASDKNL